MVYHKCDNIPKGYDIILWENEKNHTLIWSVIEHTKLRPYVVNGITHCPFCGEKLEEIPDSFKKEI